VTSRGWGGFLKGHGITGITWFVRFMKLQGVCFGATPKSLNKYQLRLVGTPSQGIVSQLRPKYEKIKKHMKKYKKI